ncbi:hypothetical protein [Kocuria sp.]|nr:hypothetical protein [Kocuria sp.]MDO5618536.1 hypothetical protein [Kocuria sp.]
MGQKTLSFQDHPLIGEVFGVTPERFSRPGSGLRSEYSMRAA